MVTKVQIPVRLAPDQAAWLREKASKEGRSPAELIRQWVAEKKIEEERPLQK